MTTATDSLHSQEPSATSPLRSLGFDGRLLFATRFIRLFAYGALSVVLVFYLIGLGLSERRRGCCSRHTDRRHAGVAVSHDARGSDGAATHADRRRRVNGGRGDRLAAQEIVAAADRRNDRRHQPERRGSRAVPVDRAGGAVARHHRPGTRHDVFAWYTLAGRLRLRSGRSPAGSLTRPMQQTAGRRSAYRSVVMLYAASGWCWRWCLRIVERGRARGRPQTETERRTLASLSGLDRSQRVVLKLSALFALDAFGGGFVVQSFAAYWFHLRFGVDPGTLGAIFFAANILAGISALVASRLAARFGLVQTMVFTHLPSNVLLILVPLMPTLTLAIGGAADPVQHQPDGRAGAAVVHDGGGDAAKSDPRPAASPALRARSGAAISPLFVGLMFARPRADQLAVLHRRHAEDRLRPAAVPGVSIREAARKRRRRGRRFHADRDAPRVGNWVGACEESPP